MVEMILHSQERGLFLETGIQLKEKAGSFLLSRECSIIDVRELDFRVRNGNGYYLSTMATGILLPILIKSFIRKTCKGAQIKLWNGNNKAIMNGNNNMVKPHDLLVMLG